MNRDGSGKRLLSTGQGRTTCSFFYPDGQHILYASTHEGRAECPPPADMRQGYVWALYPDYDIYKADVKGNVVPATMRKRCFHHGGIKSCLPVSAVATWNYGA